MSDDYWAGRTGAGTRGDAGDPSDFDRGERDRLAAMDPAQTNGSSTPASSAFTSNPTPPREWDLSGVQEGGRQFALAWAADPDRAVKSFVVQIFGFALLAAVLGALAGSWLHNGGLALTYAKIAFAFSGMVEVPLLIVAVLFIKATARGCLTILFMGGMTVFLVWTYVISLLLHM